MVNNYNPEQRGQLVKLVDMCLQNMPVSTYFLLLDYLTFGMNTFGGNQNIGAIAALRRFRVDVMLTSKSSNLVNYIPSTSRYKELDKDAMSVIRLIGIPNILTLGDPPNAPVGGKDLAMTIIVRDCMMRGIPMQALSSMFSWEGGSDSVSHQWKVWIQHAAAFQKQPLTYEQLKRALNAFNNDQGFTEAIQGFGICTWLCPYIQESLTQNRLDGKPNKANLDKICHWLGKLIQAPTLVDGYRKFLVKLCSNWGSSRSRNLRLLRESEAFNFQSTLPFPTMMGLQYSSQLWARPEAMSTRNGQDQLGSWGMPTWNSHDQLDSWGMPTWNGQDQLDSWGMPTWNGQDQRGGWGIPAWASQRGIERSKILNPYTPTWEVVAGWG